MHGKTTPPPPPPRSAAVQTRVRRAARARFRLSRSSPACSRAAARGRRRTAPHRTAPHCAAGRARGRGPAGVCENNWAGGGGGSAASASRFGGVGRLRLFPAPHGWAAGRSWPRGKELAITPSTVVGREVAPGARGRCGAGPAKRGGGVPPPSCGAFEG